MNFHKEIILNIIKYSGLSKAHEGSRGSYKFSPRICFYFGRYIYVYIGYTCHKNFTHRPERIRNFQHNPLLSLFKKLATHFPSLAAKFSFWSSLSPSRFFRCFARKELPELSAHWKRRIASVITGATSRNANKFAKLWQSNFVLPVVLFIWKALSFLQVFDRAMWRSRYVTFPICSAISQFAEGPQKSSDRRLAINRVSLCGFRVS